MVQCKLVRALWIVVKGKLLWFRFVGFLLLLETVVVMFRRQCVLKQVSYNKFLHAQKCGNELTAVDL